MRFYFLGLLLLGFLSSQGQFIVNKGVPVHNYASVYTNGEWVNEAGTHLYHQGTITTTKRFVNEGTREGSGGFILDYASDAQFKPGGTSLRLLVKKGAGKALVTGSLSVADSLLLYRGLLQLNASDTLFLQAGGALAADTGAYVSGGFFARAGQGDMTFPVGRDGHYLPLTLHDMEASKVYVTIADAPSGYTPGPGVDSLIGFPYVWTVYGTHATDTAGYVELEYPETLPIAEDLIVARAISGNQYAGMGSRASSHSGTRVNVVSYAKRLKGTFTVASGSAADNATDSLALVALYQATEGEGWTTATNWLSSTIDTWYGVTVTGQEITDIALPGNGLSGQVPDALADITSLHSVDVSENALTYIPDFSALPALTALNVSGNQLTFASLEPNADIPGLQYVNQSEFGQPLDTLVYAGSSLALHADAGGAGTRYTWKRDGVTVADSVTAVHVVDSVSYADIGEYIAEATHHKFPGLVLVSRPLRVNAMANIMGTLYADSAVAAQAGEMTLYRVQSGAFQPVAYTSVHNDGSYAFQGVVLGEYQLRGFPDTLQYATTLPTYYRNTILWESADTLSVRDYMSGVDIVAQKKSTGAGNGVIRGVVTEDDAEGRIRAVKPVVGAGVSAHRVEQQPGETQKVTLAAYDFTDHEGAFNLAGLPTGDYRFNIQYPGYPMDENSFVNITIGDEAESQVVVEATVAEGKISVRKLAITAILETEGYQADVFPNPAADVIHLRFGSPERGRWVILTDLAGRAIKRISAEEPVVDFNIRDVGNGFYLLQVTSSGIRKKTFRLTVE